ncbi:MAG: HEAT repeat domain-containing protein [Phycisphaerae bacterium]
MNVPSDRPILVILGGALAFAAAGLAGCAEPESEVERIQELEKAGKVDALAEKAIEAEPMEARLAVRSLGRMGRQAEPALRQTMQKGKPVVRAEAALVYPMVAEREKAQEPLKDLARDDPEPHVRAAAVTALGHMRAMESMEALLQALNDPKPLVRRRAADAVERIMGRAYELYLDGPEEKRLQAIEGLRQDWNADKARIRQYFMRGQKRG